MNFVLENNVTVTNWSKEPLLKLGSLQKRKLRQAVINARQMAQDACILIRTYQYKQIVKSVDRQMAKDYAPKQRVVKNALTEYFDLDMKDPGDKLRVAAINDKYVLIRDGLTGPFDIVVGHVHDWDDIKDGVGDAFRSLAQGKLGEAVSDISAIRTGTRGWIDPSASHALHRIHLNVNVIDNDPPGSIARTIVHEASHKWAHTKDVAYLKTGIKDHSKAYDNNADSFAYSARMMWMGHRGVDGTFY